MEELCNYFQAWYEIIGEDKWSGDAGCLFRTATQFRVILKRFEQIHQRAKTEEGKTIPVSRFKDALSPLDNIPFTDPDIFDAYDDSSEKPWKLLDAWIYDALESRSAATEDEIKDKDLRGVVGAGIISHPVSKEKHQVDIPPGGMYPSPGAKGTKYITAHRPKNCGYTCNIRVGFEDQLFNKVSHASKMITVKEHIPIRSTRDIENIRSGLYIELEWETIAGKVVNRIDF